MSATPPRVIAYRYLLLGLLGQGGMGRVWAARDQLLNRDVAIKELVPPPDLTAEERHILRERVMREARAIARLDHRNVVRVFDVLHDGGEPWIVMELVPSRSLYEVLDREGPMPPDRVARIGLALLAALRAAHETGLLHRDVKPANVLLADDGRVVLTDFGLATIAGDSSMTRTGIVLGSPSYLAPERALDHPVGPAADLWSLGATLYFAVEGTGPHTRSTPMATLVALTTQPPRPPQRAGALRPALAGLLQKDPANRIDAETAERLLRAAVEPVEPLDQPGPTPVVAQPVNPAPPARPLVSPPPASPPPFSPPPFSPPPLSPPPLSPRAAAAPLPEAAVTGAEPVPAQPRWRRRLITAGAVLAVLAVGLVVGRLANVSSPDDSAAPATPPSQSSEAIAVDAATPDRQPPSADGPSRRPAGKPPAPTVPKPSEDTTTVTETKPTTKTSTKGEETPEVAAGRPFINMMADTCLDVPDGATTTADVQLWACQGAGNQSFAFASDGTLRSLGKCLQIRGTGNGARLRMTTCTGASAQLFTYNGSYDLVSLKADKCVDVPDGSSANGITAQIWECTGGENQKWNY